MIDFQASTRTVKAYFLVLPDTIIDLVGAARANMTIYEAIFRTGTAQSRRTNLIYTHAWRVSYAVKGEIATLSGFSSSFQLAEDAVARHAKLIGPARRGSSAVLLESEIVETNAPREEHAPLRTGTGS